MLSGVSDVSTAVTCLDRGALDCISKPAMLEEVRARVAKALENATCCCSAGYQRNLELRVRVQATRIKELFLRGSGSWPTRWRRRTAIPAAISCG